MAGTRAWVSAVALAAAAGTLGAVVLPDRGVRDLDRHGGAR